jgi:CheY-like chemotaxis protein/HPt (histidine-containing phosphotransfer) domain-containing protein
MLEAAIAGRPFGELLMRPRVEATLERFVGRVLLVEDNEVNRRVALAVLRKLGLQVDAVVDGEEAVACVRAVDYDLVFMDMHMPRMDGLEATRLIRAREAGTTRRVPIVAMTANVVAEARTACADAGMDDFLPKPFLRSQLVHALHRWLPVSERQKGESGERPAAAPLLLAPRRDENEATIDHARLDALHSALGDDFSAVIGVFLDSAAEILAALRDARTHGDCEVLYRNAHTLKSSAANVGAMNLSALARRMEMQAKAGNAEICGTDPLEREYERVKALLLQAAAGAQEGVRAVG